MATKKPRSKKSVGLIGLGIMGSAMAANLVKGRYAVIGFDVLPEKRRRLVRAGGTAARSAADVAAAADIVICSLPSAESLLKVATELASEPATSSCMPAVRRAPAAPSGRC